MSGQKHDQFTIYAAEVAIPRYQRAGIWGLAALGILLCGLVAGWLFGDKYAPIWDDARSGSLKSVDGAALLARQEAVNKQLRERIARLRLALAGDACAPMVLEALRPVDR